MRNKIIQFLPERDEITPTEISENLGLSRQTIRRYLNQLLDEDLITEA